MPRQTSDGQYAPPGLDEMQMLKRWNAKIHAFSAFCDHENETGHGLVANASGPLSGLSVGVKDIIDVCGVPTGNGSDIHRDAKPAERDALVVKALRLAGARIVGKTTTTEFAFTDPTDCRNPYDLARSPGGSSSGSGAAVAAGMVDVALGTQTAGSLCRPAAYCGVVGFKPSYGLLPTIGVTPLAPSFDTVGVIARSVDMVARAFQAMHPVHLSAGAGELHLSLAANMLLDQATQATPELLEAWRQAAAVMEQICEKTVEFDLPLAFPRIIADHRLVMNNEAFQAHGWLLTDDRAELLKPKFMAGLQAGAAVSAGEAEEAAGRLAECKSAFWRLMSEVPLILTLPVPDGAPLMDGTTGFQDWLTPWTVFGGPLICLPWGLDSLGRPRSVMFAAHPGEDAKLLGMAQAIEELAPELPRPQCPPG